MIFLRQRPERLGQQDELIDLAGNLAPLGPEESPVHADDVAQIEVREATIGSLAELVDLGQELDPTGEILEVRKGRLAHHPDGHQAARQRHSLGPHLGAAGFLRLFEQGDRLRRAMGPVEAALIRLHTLRAEGLQFLPALQFLLAPLVHCAKV